MTRALIALIALLSPGAALADEPDWYEPGNKARCEEARALLAPYLVAPKTLSVDVCLVHVIDGFGSSEVTLAIEAQNIYGARINGRFRFVTDERLATLGVRVYDTASLSLLRAPERANLRP